MEATPRSTKQAENIIIPNTAPTAMRALLTGENPDPSVGTVALVSGGVEVVSSGPHCGSLSSQSGPIRQLGQLHWFSVLHPPLLGQREQFKLHLVPWKFI